MLAVRADPGVSRVETDVWLTDPARAGLLRSLGWEDVGHPNYMTMRALGDLGVADIGEEYEVRAVTGVAEAAALAEVHSAAFGSGLSTQEYESVMASVHYSPDRELVVEASGNLAGFCVYWLDDVNRVGLFEPLGTHPDHRRKRVGSALLAEGMRRMRDAGMEMAMVVFEGGNVGSGALYLGNGFTPVGEIRAWAKDIR